MIRLYLVALSILLAALTLQAQDHSDRLLVCNKADNSVSIFDPRSRKELAVLPTGDGPHEIAISPDGRTAVVSDYGAQKPGNTLTVIAIAEARVTKTIRLAGKRNAADGTTAEFDYLRPHGIQFTTRHHVVVTSERARRLAQVDLQRGTVLTDWSTPQTTMHMVALGPRRWFAAATSIREGSVAIFDLLSAKRQPPQIVATGEGAEGLAVNPKSREIWVGNRAADTISVVDPEKAEVAATLATDAFPFRIVFTPNGELALVSCAEGGTVEIWNAASRQRIAAISIADDGSEQGALPMGLCVDPEGKLCYVACGRGEFVAVLDIAAAEVVDRMRARRGPDGIGYARIATKK